ncbi:putative uncharacterized protein FLJ46214 [Heterocephalus glaber]|uniref:Uncharacterized protein n=1 Tax=Heterocephalus glaber TaxID=10181 RepID=A0AAX6RRX9_HETGA|nr:putative uncharacterized protein FLJ46214 [Heterocephalus glaber]
MVPPLVSILPGFPAPSSHLFQDPGIPDLSHQDSELSPEDPHFPGPGSRPRQGEVTGCAGRPNNAAAAAAASFCLLPGPPLGREPWVPRAAQDQGCWGPRAGEEGPTAPRHNDPAPPREVPAPAPGTRERAHLSCPTHPPASCRSGASAQSQVCHGGPRAAAPKPHPGVFPKPDGRSPATTFLPVHVPAAPRCQASGPVWLTLILPADSPARTRRAPPLAPPGSHPPPPAASEVPAVPSPLFRRRRQVFGPHR